MFGVENMEDNDFGLTEYLGQMNYVKLRMDAISSILKKETTTLYKYTNVEFMVLQIRKIIEHLAMGNLIANKERYSEINEKFYKNWNAKLIFRDIERINSKFFPEPINIDKSGKIDKWITKENFMTQNDAINIYEKCSGFLHTSNPFGAQTEIDYYVRMIPIWYMQIINLTNTHLVHMEDGQHIFYICMKSEKTGKPSGNLFEKIE